MREIYKYFLVALVSLGGVLFLSISLVNALFLDFLVGWIRDSRYPGYTISCETLKGGLLEGFYLGGFRIMEESSSKKILEVGDLYIRVNPVDLLNRKLTIKQARLGHVNARIRSMDDFLKNLGVLFTQGESRSPSLAYFKSMELTEVYFFDLKFLETTDMFMSKQWSWIVEEELTLNQEISFYGDLKMMGSQFHITARALGEKVGSVREQLPITLEMVLNTRDLEGQIAIQGKGVAMRNLIGMRELVSKGAVTVENRLLFSMHQQRIGSSASSVTVPGGFRIFYTLQGEGRAFFQKVKYKNFESRDLYMRASWSHRDFHLEHFQTNFLGTTFEGEYEYSPESSHSYRLFASAVDIRSILEAMRVNVERPRIKGRFALEIKGDREDIRFEPIVVEDLELFGSPVYLQNLEVSKISLKDLGKDMRIHFLSKGGSFKGGYVDKIHGDIGLSGANLFIACKGVPVDELDLLYQEDRKIPLKGRLNLNAEAKFSFEGEKPAVLSRGRLYEIEFGKYPLESLQFETQSIGLDTKIIGSLIFPLEEGRVSFLSELSAEKGTLSLEGSGLNFHYFKHGVEDFPLSAKLNGSLKISLYPKFGLSFDGRLKDFQAYQIPFKDVEFQGEIYPDHYNFSLVRGKSRFQMEGDWTLRDPFQAGITLSKLIEKRGRSSFTMTEETLSLYKPILPAWAIQLQGGKLHLSGKVQKDLWDLQVHRLILEGARGAKLSLEPFEMKLTPFERVYAQTAVELDQFGEPRQQILDLNLSGNSAQIQWKGQPIEVFREFVTLPLDLPIQGKLFGSLKLDSIFSKPQMDVDVRIEQPILGTSAERVYFDDFQARLGIDSQGSKIEKFRITKDEGAFQISGEVPFGLSKGWKFQWFDGQVMALDVNLPRTPLSVLSEVFPTWVESVVGTFAVNAELSGSYPNPDIDGMAVLDISTIGIRSNDKTYTFKDIEIDARLDRQEVKFKRLVGSYKDIDISLTGQLFPADQYRFLFRGSVQAPQFENSYLKIEQPRLEDTYLTGAMGRISGFATLRVNQGLVLYEPLMDMVKLPSKKKKIPYFNSFDFGLKILPKKDVQFRSEFFLMHTRPELTITFEPERTILDGHVDIKEGNIRLGRNDFTLNPTSLIRFVPSNENILLRSGQERFQMGSSLWESSEFQFGSLEDKLAMMWKFDGDAQPDSLNMGFSDESGKPFETYLNLRAEAEVSQRQISLGIHGPLASISYSLSSDDETLSRDDLVRLLASKGVSQGTFDRISNLSSGSTGVSQGEDGDLISKQLSAQLEDQVLAKPFESLIHDLFQLDEVRLEPGFLSSGRGIRSYRMGTRLFDDLSLTHESEFERGMTRKQTRIRLKLDDDLGLIYERDQKIDRGFELEPFEYERDVRFGFERRFRF